MKKMLIPFALVVATIAFSAAPPVATPAQAQSYASMSCSALWYARNEIYARNGYCFRTARARSVFGRGCFPPYGRLSAWEQRQVSQIQAWEARRGCN